MNLQWPNCSAWYNVWSVTVSSKLVDLAGMSGEGESNDRKQIWLIEPNCLVGRDAVASGMTWNSRPYICSKSCIPMFDKFCNQEEKKTKPSKNQTPNQIMTLLPGCSTSNHSTKTPWCPDDNLTSITLMGQCPDDSTALFPSQDQFVRMVSSPPDPLGSHGVRMVIYPLSEKSN